MLNSENFEAEVLKSEIPVIVDFFASWCGPCKMMAPVFDELADEYKGRLKFEKVDTEANQDLSGKNGIMSIPCLIVFNNGQEVERLIGFKNKATLKDDIDRVLSGL